MVRLMEFVKADKGGKAAQAMRQTHEANRNASRKKWTRKLRGWGDAPPRVRRKE